MFNLLGNKKTETAAADTITAPQAAAAPIPPAPGQMPLVNPAQLSDLNRQMMQQAAQPQAPMQAAAHPEDSHFDYLRTPDDVAATGVEKPQQLKKILEFSGVGTTPGHIATLSNRSGKTMHVLMTGPEVDKKFFAGIFSALNPAKFFGGHDDRVGFKLFSRGKKLSFLNPNNQNPHQTLKDIRAGLKSGRLQAVVSYAKNEKGGWDFNKPMAMDIVESYKGVLEDMLANNMKGIPKEEAAVLKPIIEAAAKEPQYQNMYVTNLSIVDADFQGVDAVNGIYSQQEVQASGKALSELMPQGSTFVFPNGVHNDPMGRPEAMSNSQEKTLYEFPWNHIEVTEENGKPKWHVVQQPMTIAVDKGTVPDIPDTFALVHNFHRMMQLHPEAISDKAGLAQVIQAQLANKTQLTRFKQTMQQQTVSAGMPMMQAQAPALPPVQNA